MNILMPAYEKHDVTLMVKGVKIHATLQPIDSKFAGIAREQFNAWVRDQVPVTTYGRCLIPQPDGTVKPCPRKNGNNRKACKECMKKGNFDREFITPVSLDQMELIGDISPEEHYIQEEEEREGQKRITAMFERLLEISPKHALAAALMAQGVHGEQFAKELQLGHDAANTVRKQVLDLAPQGISSIDQIDFSRLKVRHSAKDEFYRQRTLEILNRNLAA